MVDLDVNKLLFSMRWHIGHKLPIKAIVEIQVRPFLFVSLVRTIMAGIDSFKLSVTRGRPRRCAG
jgi:hypothetical protein